MHCRDTIQYLWGSKLRVYIAYIWATTLHVICQQMSVHLSVTIEYKAAYGSQIANNVAGATFSVVFSLTRKPSCCKGKHTTTVCV